MSRTKSSEKEGIPFDIRAVLAEESLTSSFQQILSVKKTMAVGVEALARAINPADKMAIAPLLLFQEAARNGFTVELDRLCRRKAVEGFAKIVTQNRDLLLFMNINTSILDDSVVGSNAIINLVREFDIAPEQVVIEIIESKARNQKALLRFVATHRSHGFLIALDDMGAGHSNLERITVLKPDIIKLDRSLIVNIDKEYHKQQLFEFFNKLAHKIGVMVIAEGIETQAEALESLDRGADLVQGFYFACPQTPEATNIHDNETRAAGIGHLLKEYRVTRFDERKSQFRQFYEIIDCICANVESFPDAGYKSTLLQCISGFPVVECVYILNESGIQASETIFNPDGERRARNALFSPAKPGADQSSKDYFMFLSESQRQFVTEQYISLASGHTCVTISTLMKNQAGKNIIVCVDIDMLDRTGQRSP